MSGPLFLGLHGEAPGPTQTSALDTRTNSYGRGQPELGRREWDREFLCSSGSDVAAELRRLDEFGPESGQAGVCSDQFGGGGAFVFAPINQVQQFGIRGRERDLRAGQGGDPVREGLADLLERRSQRGFESVETVECERVEEGLPV